MCSSSPLELSRIRALLSSSSGDPYPVSALSTPSIRGKLRNDEVFVDLSASGCHGPLPQGWEQHLDLKSGEVYYMDWTTCKRTSVDPRKVLEMANERVRQLITRAQESVHMPISMSNWPNNDNVSECCVTSAESSVSSINNGDSIDVEDELTREDMAMARDAEGILGGAPTSPPYHYHGKEAPELDERIDKDTDDVAGIGSAHCDRRDEIFSFALFQHLGSPCPEHLLEPMACARCLSRFIIHRANPWCPSCGSFLV